MELLDAIKDIVKHTHTLGFIEMVKVTGTKADLKIETKDADNTVIIYGTMNEPVVGLESTIGLSRMGLLKGTIGMHEKSTVTLVNETRNNATVPTEIKFDNGSKFISAYRLMSDAMVTEHVKVPAFKGAAWDVVATPSADAISLLSSNIGIYSSYEKRFIVKVDAGTLMFDIGSGPTDRTEVPFATGVTGTLKHSWTYPLSQVLSILKLTETAATSTMSFSDAGALKIDIDSGLGKYSFILPAGKA
jgi:hypothetical protein